MATPGAFGAEAAGAGRGSLTTPHRASARRCAVRRNDRWGEAHRRTGACLIWISEDDLDHRVVDVTARFDRLGETTMRDAGGATEYRWLQWMTRCPYPESEIARFQYDEYYERSDGGWQMVKHPARLVQTAM